jgi:nucleoid-associated protein YgaU
MSRDAKIGLVIVFAFVFLLGTILVHRLQSSTASDGGQGDGVADSAAPAVDEGDDTGEPDSEESPGVVEGTVVDAMPGDPPDAIFNQSARAADASRTIQPRSAPAHERASAFPRDALTNNFESSTGQPAAIVEQTRSEASQLDDEQEPMDEPDESAQSPAAEVVQSPATTDSWPGTRPGRAGAHAIVETQREPPVDDESSPRAANEMDSSEMAETNTDRNPADTDLSPPGVLPDADDSPRDPIRQAAGEPPPRLPKFNEARPTIESVGEDDGESEPQRPTRQSFPDESAARPKSSVPPPAQSTGQKTYVVGEGDSFWTISARFYGTGKYFRALEEYNRDRLTRSSTSSPDSRLLRPGTTIVLPDVAILRAKHTASKPAGASKSPSGSNRPAATRVEPERPPAPGTYRVQEGDTLSMIAQRELGTAKRWEEIFQLNRDRISDPRQIRAGIDLRMPTSRPGEKMAERPGTGR